MTQLLHDLGGGRSSAACSSRASTTSTRSEAAARSLAENYAGLPAGPDF